MISKLEMVAPLALLIQRSGGEAGAHRGATSARWLANCKQPSMEIITALRGINSAYAAVEVGVTCRAQYPR